MNIHERIGDDYIARRGNEGEENFCFDRGDIEELCAGSVAKVFEELGGEVIYFGKPYKEIYNMCFKPNEKVLAIGDNLRTDIKGANNLKIDSIFILNGVHINEIENEDQLNKLFKKYNVRPNYYQKTLNW